MIHAPINSYLLSTPDPSPKGLRMMRHPGLPYQQIHRNGCIEYAMQAGYEDGGGWYFREIPVCLRLLHTMQFAAMIYAKYNYFGDVRVILSVDPTSGLRAHGDSPIPSDWYRCQSPTILVERELPTSTLEPNFSAITCGMMNEVFNHFGLWKCSLFDKDGKYILKKLS